MLIKKLFGNYSKFVKFIKLFLIVASLLIASFIVLLIIFGTNNGKISLHNSKTKEQSRPSLVILNSEVDGVYFGKYKYQVLSDEIEKDNDGNFFFHNLNANITSKINHLKATADKANYTQDEESTLIEENVKLHYQEYVGFSEAIFLNFVKDFCYSQVKFTATSDENDFEALNGFRSDHIDFSKIDFWGPISINMKKKKSKITAQNMTLHVKKKDKKLLQVQFRDKVIFNNDKFNIKSDKADYLEDKKQFIFYDNLSILSDNKKLIGDIFIYDIEKNFGYVRTKKETKKRVEVYFNDKKQ